MAGMLGGAGANPGSERLPTCDGPADPVETSAAEKAPETRLRAVEVLPVPRGPGEEVGLTHLVVLDRILERPNNRLLPDAPRRSPAADISGTGALITARRPSYAGRYPHGMRRGRASGVAAGCGAGCRRGGRPRRYAVE